MGAVDEKLVCSTPTSPSTVCQQQNVQYMMISPELNRLFQVRSAVGDAVATTSYSAKDGRRQPEQDCSLMISIFRGKKKI